MTEDDSRLKYEMTICQRVCTMQYLPYYLVIPSKLCFPTLLTTGLSWISMVGRFLSIGKITCELLIMAFMKTSSVETTPAESQVACANTKIWCNKPLLHRHPEFCHRCCMFSWHSGHKRWRLHKCQSGAINRASASLIDLLGLSSTQISPVLALSHHDWLSLTRTIRLVYAENCNLPGVLWDDEIAFWISGNQSPQLQPGRHDATAIPEALKSWGNAWTMPQMAFWA